MGQTIGRATVVPEAKKFVNLPKDAVDQLWESFNDVAEGFGLSIEEFLEINRTALKEYMELSDKKIDQLSAKVFAVLDDDKNDLIDALEFLGTFALLSGMSQSAKANFVFNIYDFDESGELTVDEMTLALRSCITGLAKLSGTEPPLEPEIEKIALNAFKDTDKDAENLISRSEFVHYCSITPELTSWIEFFDDIQENIGAAGGDGEDGALALDVEARLEGERQLRPPEHVAATDPDDGAADLLAIEDRGFAEEFMPIKPWMQVVNYTVPTDIPEIDNTAPDQGLELEWVHGYNAQSCRNNLRYTVKGEIVYSAASLGVVLNAEEHKQRFLVDHTDEVNCFAVHHVQAGNPDTYVATGCVGRRPKVQVWSTDTMEVISSITGLHQNGVTHVDFSPDGERLVMVGNDDLHSVAVYKWRSKERLFASSSTAHKVLDCRFIGEDTFATCGVGHMIFWSRMGSGYAKHTGIFGKKGKPQTMLCAGAVEALVVSGTESGHLYVWEGRNCKKSVQAHHDAVNALYVVEGAEGGLVTGSRDGKVRLWNALLEPGATFEIGGLGGVACSVRSVCWDVALNKILVGTSGSEIYEISATDGADLHLGPLIQGHCADELWGLAMHPFQAEFCTVGDDCTVRIWNGTTFKLERMVKLDTMARSCAYSPDGANIVVGLGGDVGRGKNKKDGAWLVLNQSDLTVAYETRDSKEWISVVKYSPDGKTIAVGSTDRGIYLYNADDFASKGKCKGHKGPITHIDFSADSQFIRSNCGAAEILFWSSDTGEQQTPSSTMKDVQWSTDTTPLSWSVQGVWPPYADGTEVNASARSSAGTSLATADDFGRIRLYRYPCVVPKETSFTEFRGHASHAMNISFAHDDTYVISVGGRDRCVFQWHNEVDGEEDEASDDEMDMDSEDQEDFKDGQTFDRTKELEAANRDDQAALFALDSGSAEDFAAVKPWLGSTVPPSRPPPENNSEPDSGLKLEWVHGYRAQDCRNNLRYTLNDDVVYFAAQTNVVLQVHDWKQRFHAAHTDDIISMALHPTMDLIATGQMGRVPSISVWNPTTMETKCVLQGFHRRAVSLLAFSNDGKLLASVGHDDEHSLAIYDWENQTIKAHARSTSSKVLALDFMPDGRGLITVGVGHVKFWTLRGRNLTCKRGLLGKKGNVQPLLCIGWAGNSPIIGTADGHLYRFQGRQLQVAIKAHERSVNALYSCNEGLCSGGKDGMVRLWTTSLECTVEVDMAVLGAFNPCVRSVCWNPDSNKILIGTRGSEIFEVSASDGSNLHGTGALLQGHCAYELWGLAVHPINPEYCTVGDDKTVRVWDIATRKLLRMAKLDTYARSCAYSPDGTKLAVGLGGTIAGRGKQKFDGKFVILHPDDLELIHEARDSKKWIQELKFSSDGNTLAVGSRDNKIYLYDVGNGFAIKATISKHNSFISHLDFSADSQYVQSNCGAYELLFHEADTGMHIPAASRLKDVRWGTWTCTLGWAVQGAWPQAQDGTVINACDRSASGQTLATADAFGRLKLYRYPCLTADASSKCYRGHSANIRQVRWAGGDSHLISVGGTDRCIFQWVHDDDEVGAEDRETAEVAGESGEDSDVEVGDEEIDVTEDLEDFMAVKPWISAVVPPTNAPEGSLEPPPVELELEFVHGYQAQTASNNLRYNALGEVVFHAAGMGIVYNRQQHGQRFFRLHDDDIACLDVSVDGSLVATGQKGAQPQVRVWDSSTCLQVACLPKFHRRGITSVAFSPDKRMVVSVGADVNHTVAVWRSASGEWFDAMLLACECGDQQKVLFARFTGIPSGQSKYKIVTGGVQHIKFWTLENRTIKGDRGVFGQMGKVQPMLCAATAALAVQGRGGVVSGSVSGHMYVWDGRNLVKAIKAHARSCSALYACAAGVVSGGKDGLVKLWDTSLGFLQMYDLMEAAVPPYMAAVRSVSVRMDWEGEQITKILVGTRGSEIYEISKDTGSMLQLAEGHCTDELWGLAMHPTNPDLLATSGDDRTVRVWSVKRRRMLRKAALDCMVRAVAWSPDGSKLAVGLGGSVGKGRQKKDGAFIILDADTMEVEYEGRDSRQWISDVKFSPDGKTLAMGSHDDKIYLYDGKTFALRAKCEKHNSFITHMDFSTDSSYLQSNCGAYELLYYNAMDGTFISSASQLKDAQWATWTCVLGWPVQGAFISLFRTFWRAAVDRGAMSDCLPAVLLTPPPPRRPPPLLLLCCCICAQAFGQTWRTATTRMLMLATARTVASCCCAPMRRAG
jgi:WD40 repeat protein/Ca2+-binding EF-hand superfamily protein